MTQRFYFHDAATTVGGTLPNGPQINTTPTVEATGARTLRSMDGTPGSSQVSASLATGASTATSGNSNLFRMFVSPPLAAQSVPAGVTITMSVGASESNGASNMFAAGSLKAYFWRPSTGAIVTDQWNGSGTTSYQPIPNEPGTSQTHCTGTMSGTLARTLLDGDVLVVELWSRQAQSMAVSYTNTVFYDGTTEGSTTNIAAYIDAGMDLALFVATNVSVGQINQSAATFNPTVIPGAVSVTPNLISQTAQIHAPTATPGAVSVIPNLISQTAQIHTPSLVYAQTISLGLIDRTAVIHVWNELAKSQPYLPLLSTPHPISGTFFTDPFDGSALSGDWEEYEFNDMPVSVAGGNVVFTHDADTNYAEIDSTSQYNLTGRLLSLEIAQLDDRMGIGLGAEQAVGVANGPELSISRAGGLYVLHATSGDIQFPWEVTLGSLPERLVLREQDGSWQFSYVSGGTEIAFGSFVAPEDPSALYVFLSGITGISPAVGAVAAATSFSIYETSQLFALAATSAQQVSVGLIDQTAQIHAATVATLNTISVAQISQAAAAFAPSVSTDIALGLINQAAQIHAPTTTATASVVLGRITQTSTANEPTVTATSAANVGFIDQTAVIFNTTVIQQQFVVLGLVDQTAVINAATITTANNISVGLIDQTATISAPTLTSLATIALDLIDLTATAHEPVVDSGQAFIVLGQINQTAAANAPTITTGAAPLSVGLIDQTAQPRTPTVTTANSISLGLIDQSAATFAPAITQASEILLGQIDQTAQSFAPTISAGGAVIDLGLISQPAAGFVPTVTTSANIDVGLINQAAISLELSISTTGDQNVALDLINSSAVAYGISVSGGAQQGNRPGRWFGYGNPPYEPPVDRDQRLKLAMLYASTEVFSPSVDASDDEVILGLSEDDLLVLA